MKNAKKREKSVYMDMILCYRNIFERSYFFNRLVTHQIYVRTPWVGLETVIKQHISSSNSSRVITERYVASLLNTQRTQGLLQ